MTERAVFDTKHKCMVCGKETYDDDGANLHAESPINCLIVIKAKLETEIRDLREMVHNPPRYYQTHEDHSHRFGGPVKRWGQ